MFVLPDDLPLLLTPFAFMVGTWEGTGKISERYRGETIEHSFIQRIEFAHNNQNYLTYYSTAKLLDDSGLVLPSEVGFWRLAKPHEPSDAGPGLLPGIGESQIKTRDDLERLRNDKGGFDITASILHPSGVSEYYAGQIKGARVDLQTTQGLLPAHLAEANPVGYAERMYGGVQGKLVWVWEAREMGKGGDLVPLASAELERVG
jgi:hypothetical protein